MVIIEAFARYRESFGTMELRPFGVLAEFHLNAVRRNFNLSMIVSELKALPLSRVDTTRLWH